MDSRFFSFSFSFQQIHLFQKKNGFFAHKYCIKHQQKRRKYETIQRMT